MSVVYSFLGLLLILTISTNAFPLSALSDKLTADKTKERVPELHLTDGNNNNENKDQDVLELDDLKAHKDDVVDTTMTEKLVDSLKKLHKEHHHDHPKEEEIVVATEKPVKSFRGAARLAYGQHPEMEVKATESTNEKQHNDNGLPETSELPATITSNGQRRSLKNDLSQNAGNLLRHNSGKYSAFDMSQYIFWTGDEDGVAKAVEELIDEGLMSREVAINFLNDIRLGIEYLENTYTFRDGGEKEIVRMRMKPYCKVYFNFCLFFLQTIPITKLTTSTTSTTEQSNDDTPYNYQRFQSLFKASHKDIEHPTLSPAAVKAIEKMPSLLKLAEINNLNKKEPTSLEYDEQAGRLRLADFLYGEYSLEEVIYQLSKTMFSQSLTHGSEEAQLALQKLTAFLELEGNRGHISPALQKKVLDVLLAALSDTLVENPEIMSKAREVMGTK
ncbi:unnamed protein product [Diamesa hyperborea]